jgi:hypothetical protein
MGCGGIEIRFTVPKGTIYHFDDWGDDRPPNNRMQRTPPGEKMRRRR